MELVKAGQGEDFFSLGVVSQTDSAVVLVRFLSTFVALFALVVGVGQL